MRNAKKTLSLVMVAIFTTFIVLSGVPTSAAVKKQTKAQIAAAAKVKAAAAAAKAAKAKADAAKAAAAKIKAAKDAEAFRIASAAKAALAAATKAVENAEKLTDANNYDLVGDDTDFANASAAVTAALELIIKVPQNSNDYKGLMARINSANNDYNAANDARDKIEADKQTALDKAAAEKAAAEALVKAVAAAETAVVAVEKAPLATAADVAAVADLAKTAATAVAAVSDPAKAAPFTARIATVQAAGKVVLDKIAADKVIADKKAADEKAAKDAADLIAATPAKVVTVSAVDGIITVTFDKAPITGQSVTAADFTVTKVVTTTSGVSSVVVPTVATSGTAVTLTVPVTVAAAVDQAISYSVAYTTGAAIVANVAAPVAKIPAVAVASVDATNLKAMVVKFNKAIDGTTVTATTVKLTKAGSDVVTARTVTADKMAVVIEFAGVAQSDSLVLTVDGVKNTDGKETVSAYTLTKTVTDVTIPASNSAAAVNQKQITVYFNEPINFAKTTFQVLNNVKVDGIAVIAKATPDNVKNSVVFDLPSTLTAGAHTVSISDMVDYAGFKALSADYAISVAADTTAPVMTAAEAKNISTIRVTFNESLEVVGAFKVNTVTATTATPVAGSNNTQFDLTGGFANLDLSAIVEVAVAYSGQADVAGNTVSTETTLKFAVKDDTALPTVAVSIDAANIVTLTFAKSMNTGLGTVKATSPDGTTTVYGTYTVAASEFTAGTNNTELVIPAASLGINNIDAAQIKLDIKNMKDATIRANLLPEAFLTVSGKDTKKPTVDNSYFVKNGATTATDKVTFYFSEVMDQATLNNLSNYVGSTIGSLSTLTGAKVDSIAADSKSITLIVPAISTKGAETFTVYALKDLNGNMSTTNSTVALLAGTTLSATAAETTDGSKVKVTFDTKLTTYDPSSLKVQKFVSGAWADYAVFVNATIDTTGKIVTFTANKSLGTDTNSTLYKLVANNASLAVNIYGKDLTTGTIIATITDKVRPTVTVAADATAGIKITFSEAVNATDIVALNNDLIIRDADGLIVPLVVGTNAVLTGGTSALTNFTTITFAGTSGASYTVQLLSRGIKDLSAQTNVVTEGTAVTVVAK